MNWETWIYRCANFSFYVLKKTYYVMWHWYDCMWVRQKVGLLTISIYYHDVAYHMTCDMICTKVTVCLCVCVWLWPYPLVTLANLAYMTICKPTHLAASPGLGLHIAMPITYGYAMAMQYVIVTVGLVSWHESSKGKQTLRPTVITAFARLTAPRQPNDVSVSDL